MTPEERIAEFEAERLWITRKLGLDAEVTISDIQGRLHVACHNEGLTKDLIKQQRGWTERIAELECQLVEWNGAREHLRVRDELITKLRCQLLQKEAELQLPQNRRILEIRRLEASLVAKSDYDPNDGTALHLTPAQKAEREQFVEHLRADLGCDATESVRAGIARLKSDLAALRNTDEFRAIRWKECERQNAALVAALGVAEEALRQYAGVKWTGEVATLALTKLKDLKGSR